ncbi:MAG: hypothetical protein WCE91_08325 [Nitrososphaeraceae archaeon]
MNKGLDILAWYPACTVSRLMGVSWSDKTLIRALSFLGPQSTTSRLPLGGKAKVVVSSLERHIVTMLAHVLGRQKQSSAAKNNTFLL